MTTLAQKRVPSLRYLQPSVSSRPSRATISSSSWASRGRRPPWSRRSRSACPGSRRPCSPWPARLRRSSSGRAPRHRAGRWRSPGRPPRAGRIVRRRARSWRPRGDQTAVRDPASSASVGPYLPWRIQCADDRAPAAGRGRAVLLPLHRPHPESRRPGRPGRPARGDAAVSARLLGEAIAPSVRARQVERRARSSPTSTTRSGCSRSARSGSPAASTARCRASTRTARPSPRSPTPSPGSATWRSSRRSAGGPWRSSRTFPEEAWSRRGIASDNPFSVRALAYITAGHLAHHLAVLRERYAGGDR